MYRIFDLEECLLRLNLSEWDIFTFSKICVSFSEHKKAIGFISKALDVVSGDEKSLKRIRCLQGSIIHSMKKANAVLMISRGDSVDKIEVVTRLPKNEIIEMQKRFKTDAKYAEEVRCRIKGLRE